MNKNDEKVLVVPADILFKDGRWQGLKKDNLDEYVELIKNNYQLKRRGDVETDPSFKQIIPYIIFNYQDQFFIYKYLPKAGEQRLVDTYQIGVGGHINEIDGKKESILEKGMMREWDEEVHYQGTILEKNLVGILNDDSAPVESVHLGLVYTFVGDSADISIKENEKMQGEMVALKDIGAKIKSNNGIWIKLVYRDYLHHLTN